MTIDIASKSGMQTAVPLHQQHTFYHTHNDRLIVRPLSNLIHCFGKHVLNCRIVFEGRLFLCSFACFVSQAYNGEAR